MLFFYPAKQLHVANSACTKFTLILLSVTETEFSEKKFCELIGGIGKVDAKELKKHLIPSADVGEESAAALFKEWKKFKPHTCNWDMLSKALVEMKADETTISVAESYIGECLLLLLMSTGC